MFGKKGITVVLMTALIISQFSIVSAAQEKWRKHILERLPELYKKSIFMERTKVCN